MFILRGQQTEVRCLSFSPSGNLLASGGVNKSVRLWDRRTGRARTVFRDHPGYVHAVSFAPDGRTLGVAAKHLFLRHLETGATALGRIEELYHAAGDVHFAPDGRMALSVNRAIGGRDLLVFGTVTVWGTSVFAATTGDAAGGGGREDGYRSIPRRDDITAALQQALGQSYPVWTAAFSPTGRDLALGTANVGVLLWDLAQGQFRKRLNTGAPVRAVAFSPDGQLLAGAADQQVHVWDAQSGTPVATFRGHRNRVTSLAFGPGGAGPAGATLLSGSEDGTVRLWEATTGRERAAFSWPTGKVRAVAFAPDGMTAAAAGYTGEIILWDIDDG
jgi:WD40 repeat protein